MGLRQQRQEERPSSSVSFLNEPAISGTGKTHTADRLPPAATAEKRSKSLTPTSQKRLFPHVFDICSTTVPPLTNNLQLAVANAAPFLFVNIKYGSILFFGAF